MREVSQTDKDSIFASSDPALNQQAARISTLIFDEPV